jgi:hypothetical protein
MTSSTLQSAHRTTTGALVAGRCRLLDIYFTNTATASSLIFRSGGAGGTVKLTLVTPADAGGRTVRVSKDGILFEDGVHVTFGSAEATSVTVAFDGGAPA